MGRTGRYTIVAVILLILAAVWGKVLLTAVWLQPQRSLAEEGRQIRGRWERGWPVTFQKDEVPISLRSAFGVPAAPQWDIEAVSVLNLLLNVALALVAGALIAVWLLRRLSRPRPWTFSLQGLLVVTALIAAVLGWWLREQHLWQREQASHLR